MKLDGYDSVGRIAPEDFRAYGQIIAEKLALWDGASIYEVGCGSGAFLYTLRELFSLQIGGNDYAAGLLETAKEYSLMGISIILKQSQLTPKQNTILSYQMVYFIILQWTMLVK